MLIPSLLAGAAGLVAASVLPAQAAPDPLARYRWSKRVLVVIAPDATDSRVAEQRTILRSGGAGTAERDLVLLEAAGDTSEAAAMRSRFGVPGDRFAAILVGKDGGAKLRSDHPLGTAALFDEIDAMPMRRSEARERARP